MTSLAVLRSFLGENNFYVKGFEDNCKASPSESSVNQGVGILDAVKRGYSEDTIQEEIPNDAKILETKETLSKRVAIDNLPPNIEKIINELNDNIVRNNPNAFALLVRKILTISCFTALDKIGKNDLLQDKELNEILNVVKNELKISDKVMSKVKSSKWLGDSANHSYKVKINESDVDVAITGLRIFLEEIF